MKLHRDTHQMPHSRQHSKLISWESLYNFLAEQGNCSAAPSGSVWVFVMLSNLCCPRQVILTVYQCQSKIFNVARIAQQLCHEGAVESQNYVRKRLTKKECFKTLTEDGQRRGWPDVRWQWVPEEWCSDWKCLYCVDNVQIRCHP